MSLTEAKKRANAKYQAKTIASLACRVKKEQAEAFKAYCESAGKTSNAALKDFVLGCIGEQEPGAAPETPQEAPGRPAGGGGIFLHPKALRTAQEAAQSVGETVPQFVERAVETQAKRDRSSLALGINPVTGEKLDRKG